MELKVACNIDRRDRDNKRPICSLALYKTKVYLVDPRVVKSFLQNERWDSDVFAFQEEISKQFYLALTVIPG
jgi:hypothetical protein